MGAEIWHLQVARYYGAPSLSMRDLLLQSFAENRQMQDAWFSKSHHHPSCVGLASIALALTSLLARASDTNLSDDIASRRREKWRHLPPLDLNDSLHGNVMRPMIASGDFKSECIMVGQNDKLHTLPRIQKGAWYTGGTNAKPALVCSSRNAVAVDLAPLRIHIPKVVTHPTACSVSIAFTLSWRTLFGQLNASLEGGAHHVVLDAWDKGTGHTVQEWSGLIYPPDAYKLAGGLGSFTSLSLNKGTDHNLAIRCTGRSSVPNITTGEKYPDAGMVVFHGVAIVCGPGATNTSGGPSRE